MFVRAIAMALIAVTVAACSQQDDTEVLARIDGEPITRTQFEAYMEFKRIPADNERRREAAWERYLEREALARAIDRTDALDQALLEAELADFRNEMVISRYFQSHLDDRVSEDAIESYYRNHAEDYETEQVRVAHILQRTHSDMDESERQARLTTLREAYARISAGADFAEVAKEYSEDKVSSNRGGGLGWLNRGAIDEQFSQAMFNTPTGEVSAPFETPFGFHIIKVLEGPVTTKRSLDSVRGDIRHQLRTQARDAELERLVDAVDVEVVDGLAE